MLASGRAVSLRWQPSGICDLDRLLVENCPPHGGSSLLIRRSCFDEVGGFDTALPSATDFEMWLRIAAHTSTPAFLGIRRWLVDYRLTRPGSISGNRTARYQALDTILDRYVPRLTRLPAGLAYVRPAVFAYRDGADEFGERWARQALTAGRRTITRDHWGLSLLAWHEAGPAAARPDAPAPATRSAPASTAARTSPPGSCPTPPLRARRTRSAVTPNPDPTPPGSSSEAARREEVAVGALVLGGAGEPLGRRRQGVLLDDQPPRPPGVAQDGEQRRRCRRLPPRAAGTPPRDHTASTGSPSATMAATTSRLASLRCTWLILDPKARSAATGSPPPTTKCPVSRQNWASVRSSTRSTSHGASTKVPVSLWNVGSYPRSRQRDSTRERPAAKRRQPSSSSPIDRSACARPGRPGAAGRPRPRWWGAAAAPAAAPRPRRRCRASRRARAAPSRARRRRRRAAPGRRPPGRARARRAGRRAPGPSPGSRPGRGRCPRSPPTPPRRARAGRPAWTGRCPR